MKSLLSLLLIVLIASCGSQATYEKAADAQEAGTEFIRASLDGDYNKALFYLYRDSTNTNLRLLEKWKADYNRRNEEDKVKYKDASIIALSITPENDSVQNFVYTNSFEPTDTTTIRVIRLQNEWLVDLKDIH